MWAAFLGWFDRGKERVPPRRHICHICHIWKTGSRLRPTFVRTWSIHTSDRVQESFLHLCVQKCTSNYGYSIIMLVRDQHCDGVPNYATKCINFRLINTLIMIKPTPNFAQQCRALFPTRRPCDHKGTGRQLRKWCAWCLMRAAVDRQWDIADCTLLTLGSFHLNGVYVLGCMIPETGHRDKFTQMCVRHFAWFVFLVIC